MVSFKKIFRQLFAKSGREKENTYSDGVTRIDFAYSHPGADDTPAWTLALTITVGSP